MKIRFHRSSYRSFVVVLPNVKLEQFLFKKKKKKKKKVKPPRYYLLIRMLIKVHARSEISGAERCHDVFKQYHLYRVAFWKWSFPLLAIGAAESDFAETKRELPPGAYE